MTVAQNIMIGLMKCSMAGIEAGSVTESSIVVKPNYREHKTGYPQLSDLKALLYAESTCKVVSEETNLFELIKSTAIGLACSIPIEIPFIGLAPGIGGTTLEIRGIGYGSSCSIKGSANSFGSCELNSTSLTLDILKNDITNNNIFVTPNTDSQAITIDKDNLLYGAPTINGTLCTTAQFNASSQVKYFTSEWPPIIDAAVFEDTSFSINAKLEAPTDSDLLEIKQSMIPGSLPVPKARKLVIPTVGGSNIELSMDGLMLASLNFSPGNDWNSLDVTYQAVINNPNDVGINWANIT